MTELASDGRSTMGGTPTVLDVDTVLSTTRSVRQRLDLDRPVPDQVILDCIDLAEQAPTGGNLASRRWLVVRDPARKEALAELYREAGGSWIIDAAQRLAGSGRPNEAVTRSGAYLAEHLGRVPAIVIPTIWGTYDGGGRPGLFDSVLQAAWSFCLALRARGLGSAWTTVHLGRAAEVAALLGIPEGVTQVVLLPVAYTIGTEFKPAARRAARDITYFDTWGVTQGADGPELVGEREIGAPPEQVAAAARSLVDGLGEGPAAQESARPLSWTVGEPAGPTIHTLELDPLPGRRTRVRYSIAPPGSPGEIEARLTELAQRASAESP